MKRIRPRFMIVFMGLLAFFVLSVPVIELKLHKIDFEMIFCGIPTAFLLLYLPLAAKIEYYEGHFTHYAFWKKKEVFYSDIVRISCSKVVGAYQLITYDNENYGFYIPLEHKKLRGFFDTIKESNPNVQINVWWYEKLPVSKKLKTALKFAFFIVVVVAVDFLINFLKDR